MHDEATGDADLPRPVEAVKDLLVERWRQVCAAQTELLLLVRSYGDIDGARVDQSPNVATTLCFLLGCTGATARALATQAGIIDRPDVADALASGAVTPDHLTVLARRGATPDNVAKARELDAEDLAFALRKEKPPTPDDDASASKNHRWDMRNLPDSGDVVGSFRVSPADGEKIRQAIERELEDQPVNPATGVHDSMSKRMADAAVGIFGHAIAKDADPDRATVSIHVDLPDDGDLSAATGYLADGTHIANTTLQRLLCDCRLEAHVVSKPGEPLRFSVMHRTPWPAQVRAVRRRQGGHCAWPGCHRRHFLHCHHLWHWAKGGPTALWNLVGLCSYHHHLVHEGGWSMTGSPDRLVIHNPAGIRWRPPWQGLTIDDDDRPLRFNLDLTPV